MSDRTPLERDIDISRKYGKLTLYQIVERMEKAEAEVSSLESQLQELRTKTYCAYCGAEFSISEEQAKQAVTKHIYECVEHPVYIATKRAESLEVRLQAVSEALQKYGRHKMECAIYNDSWPDLHTCSCGFTGALAPPTEPSKEAK